MGSKVWDPGFKMRGWLKWDGGFLNAFSFLSYLSYSVQCIDKTCIDTTKINISLIFSWKYEIKRF